MDVRQDSQGCMTISPGAENHGTELCKVDSYKVRPRVQRPCNEARRLSPGEVVRWLPRFRYELA